jgi:uncharacterized protein (DUF1800 family)
MGWIQKFWRGATLAATLALSACGGGDDSSSSTSSTASVQAPLSISAGDAVRLAQQGTFGPTKALIDHIQALGSADAWLNEQFGLTDSSYTDLKTRAVAVNYCSTMVSTAQAVCNRDYLSSTPVAMEFYAHAVQNNDQLRQRVAWALSQLIVASDVEVHSTAGLAVFNQIFLDNAYGNYRDILQAVTLNPYMGDYLDMANSSKAAPNQNYARELMQLFSIGVNQLNMDGSAVKDATGATVPSYTETDVSNVARALTGWTYARLNGAAITDNNQLDYSSPMIVNTAIYDSTAKTFLGTTVAASATPADSIKGVLDAVFNNASTAPYVSKFLIQHLVVSNPSAAYVQRVATIFANNGSGTRGDMKAVIRAILTDAEARGTTSTAANPGKVKEPALLLTSLARLIADKTDGYALTTRDAAMGQSPFRSGSVFNFYPPDYPLPLGNGLLSPPTKLMTAATIIARHNLLYDWTVTGDVTSRSEYAVQSTIAGSIGTTPDWSDWQTLGADTTGLITRINLLMMANSMSGAQQSALASAINAVTNSDPTTQARKRAQVALYVVASSPQFQVER